MPKRYKNILITGGAGFIGSNASAHFLEKGDNVTVFDNFSRKGSETNAKWLTDHYPKNVEIVNADIVVNKKVLSRLVEKSDAVLHLAGQVAVTTSVRDPRNDFKVNAYGTLNVLEAIRMSSNKPALVYSSTNKVYGEMLDTKVLMNKTRYTYKDYPNGISEKSQLDFHSPYGCSKGCADQYVKDYAKIYGLKTVVFRQSCIYGPRQMGIEDQGWVAWFVIAALNKKPITVYGDGKQVRDLLYIDDLCEAYELALNNMNKISGEVFNIGGGVKNTLSVWEELAPILERYLSMKINVSYSNWRPGDQKIFISDITKIKKALGWEPKTSVEDGIIKLCEWVKNNKAAFRYLSSQSVLSPFPG
jgi:CDP-paratose 2-epimerase